MIRESDKKDCEELCELFDELNEIHRDPLPDAFKKIEKEKIKEFTRRILSDENSVIFVAENAGKLIGFIHASIKGTDASPAMLQRRYGWIHDLMVRKEYRGHGVGRALDEKVRAWALGKNVNEIELNVWEFNRGTFYESVGYETMSRRMRIMLK